MGKKVGNLLYPRHNADGPLAMGDKGTYITEGDKMITTTTQAVQNGSWVSSNYMATNTYVVDGDNLTFTPQGQTQGMTFTRQ